MVLSPVVAVFVAIALVHVPSRPNALVVSPSEGARERAHHRRAVE